MKNRDIFRNWRGAIMGRARNGIHLIGVMRIPRFIGSIAYVVPIALIRRGVRRILDDDVIDTRHAFLCLSNRLGFIQATGDQILVAGNEIAVDLFF